MTKKLGIVGGGQLGRMLAEAAKKIKVETIVLDPTDNSPAGQITDQIVGDYKNYQKILELAKRVNYLTFEVEGANAKALTKLATNGMGVNPKGDTLEMIQDKLVQKEFLLANNIPVAQFVAVQTEKDIQRAAEYLGYPLVLKTRFHGFDGRGNALIGKLEDIPIALKKLAGKKLYVEKYIAFTNELAVQIVRDRQGMTKEYPLVETFQENDICHTVKFPTSISAKAQKSALKLAKKTVDLLEGAGVFAVEMFLTTDNIILINEIAPRVHNSGHWTIEGCQTSQFENHVRAVTDLPIKSTGPKVKSAVMINILGKRNGLANKVDAKTIQKLHGVYVHIYGKFETRVDRKMGHITVVGNNLNQCLKKAEKVRQAISI